MIPKEEGRFPGCIAWFVFGMILIGYGLWTLVQDVRYGIGGVEADATVLRSSSGLPNPRGGGGLKITYRYSDGSGRTFTGEDGKDRGLREWTCFLTGIFSAGEPGICSADIEPGDTIRIMYLADAPEESMLAENVSAARGFLAIALGALFVWKRRYLAEAAL